MYEIAIVFWTAVCGAILMLSVIGGTVDALLRLAARPGKPERTPSRPSPSCIEPTAKVTPIAEAA